MPTNSVPKLDGCKRREQGRKKTQKLRTRKHRSIVEKRLMWKINPRSVEFSKRRAHFFKEKILNYRFKIEQQV